MDYSDRSIGLSTNSVDGSPLAFPSVETPELTVPAKIVPDREFGPESESEYDDALDVHAEHAGEPVECQEHAHTLEAAPVERLGVENHGAFGVTSIEPTTAGASPFLRLVRSGSPSSAPSDIPNHGSAKSDGNEPASNNDQNDQNDQSNQHDRSDQTERVISNIESSLTPNRQDGRANEEGRVLNLFGEVSDEAFPEVSANHPARSGQGQSRQWNSTGSQTMTAAPSMQLVPGARAKRTLASLSNHPVSSPLERSMNPEEFVARQQIAPARSRSYERRRPGSVGGVRTNIAPRLTPDPEGHAGEVMPPSIDQRPTELPTNSPKPPTAELLEAVRTQGVRVFRTSGISPSADLDTIIDLRAAEYGRPVVRRQTTDAKAVAPAASLGPANYFDGHQYENAAGNLAARNPRGPSANVAANGTVERRIRRISYRSMLRDRTGLSSRMLSGLSIGVVGLLGVGLLYSPVFSLHNVDIRRGGAASSRIRRATQLQNGDPLISVDVPAVQRRIAAMPEISAAKVERIWPRGLRITVTTRTPVAALVHGGRIVLVAEDATVLRDLERRDGLTVVDDDITYLPLTVKTLAPIGKQLTGASKQTVALVAALDPDLRDRVTSVAVNGDDMTATLSSAGKVRDLVVHFGDDHELAMKARALGALLGAGSTVNVVGIDLTVPDAPVLRLNGAKAAVSTFN
jgi:cell division protein FtsQ